MRDLQYRFLGPGERPNTWYDVQVPITGEVDVYRHIFSILGDEGIVGVVVHCSDGSSVEYAEKQ